MFGPLNAARGTPLRELFANLVNRAEQMRPHGPRLQSHRVGDVLEREVLIMPSRKIVFCCADSCFSALPMAVLSCDAINCRSGSGRSSTGSMKVSASLPSSRDVKG
jgi:hypothetical protein